MLSIPIGIPFSFAFLTNLQAEYVAKLLPITKMREDVFTASSAASLTGPGIDSPNIITAGFSIPAVLEGNHPPSLSVCILPLISLARHVGHAGYLKVLYGAPGISTSPSGFVLKPFLRRSSGFSVSSAPDARTSWRKAAHAGFRVDSWRWKSAREYSLRQVKQTSERR